MGPGPNHNIVCLMFVELDSCTRRDFANILLADIVARFRYSCLVLIEQSKLQPHCNCIL